MQLNRGIPRIGAINRSHPHASGLVSCWRVMPDMERGTKWYDLAGRSDGALSGPIWRGDGLRFDGDDYATISNSNVLNFGTGAFAISAWVKADNPSSNADGIFSKDSFAGGSSYTGFLLNVGDSNKWAFETRNVVSGSGPRAQVVSVANAGTDRTHLVGVRDGISPAPLRLYVNGVLVNSETEAAEANISNNTTATIGALNADFLGQYFNGVIEAVSAYNRALSATEVSQLYRDPLGMFNRVRVPVGPKRTPVTPRGSALTLNRGIPRIGAINRSHPHARGLVSCWRAMPDMERGTRWRDLAGKNDGTLVNGPTWRADGLRFDGSDDYVTASDAGLPIGTASRTMSAWVRVPSTPGADKGVLSYGSAGTNFQASVLYVQGSTGKAGFSNWVDAGALTPGSIADDKWHHLVAMLSAGGEMRVFVDGEFAVLVVQSMNTTSVGSVSIGQFGNGQGGFINAAINDCRIYNRALSAAEIKSLYTDPPGMFNRVRVPVTVKRTPVTPRGSALTLNRGIPRVGAINRSHPLATGLAAFWYGIPGRNGGSQLYDLAGKYNGALSGDARWQGNRLAFDGNDDYVNFGDVLNVGLSDFTVRVVAATTGSDFSLLAKSRAAQATGRWYLLYTGGAMLAQITDPSVSALGPTWTTTSILDGAPHCITATFSRSGNATIYSDGVIQMASTIAAFSAVDLTTTYPLLMGKYNNTDGSVSGNILPLNGTISSAAMWMRCLSPTEVMADYRESRAGFPTLLNRVRVPIGPKRTPVTPRGSALTLNRGIPRIGAINRSHPLASGLLACWRALPDMERGTKWRDLAGKNDGTLVNGPVWRADGLSFDGSSHYVSVADSPTLTPAAISVSAWIYVTGGEGTYRGIVTKGNGSNDQSFALQINNSTNRIEFWVSSNGTTIASVFGTTAFTAAAGNLNVWKHVTGTYDGTSYKIYVNGVLEGTDTVVTGALWDSSSAISIGKWAGGFSDYFPGRMKDVRIYDRALSATEVKSLYNDPLGMFNRVRVPVGPKRTPVTPRGSALTLNRGIPRIGAINRSHPHARGLVSCWRAMPDMERGTKWYDLAGKNHGTLTNGPTWRADGLRFDGSDDYVSVPDSPSLNFTTEDLTYSLWYKIRSFGAYDGFIAKGGDQPQFVCGGSSNTFSFWKANNSAWFDGAGTITLNTWEHVAVVKTGSVVRLYQQGLEVASGTQAQSFVANSTAMQIGSDTQAGGRLLDGVLNDIRIYNRALSATEVASLYRDPLGMFGRVRVPIGRFAETQAGSGGGGWIFRSRLFRSPIIYGGW